MHLALLVGTIVALLLASFVLFVHLNSFFKIKNNHINGLIAETNQYVFKFLETPKLQIGDTLQTEIEKKSTKTHLSFYGCWQKVFLEKHSLKSKYSKVLLAGAKVDLNTPNLYLKNSNSPLILVGKTTLKGTVFLPKQGVKAGTISGNYFQNSQLVFGKTNYSQSKLPDLNKQWIRYVKGLFGNSLLVENEVIELTSELKNTFKKPKKLIYQASSINLGQGEIHGNIIIKSATSITVNAGVSLIDVILIAPKIKIKDNVKGVFQAFAKNDIKVGKNCKLSFPSSLIVLKKEEVEVPKIVELPIEIGEGSTIEGNVVFFKEQPKIKKKFTRGIKTHLKINKNVRIGGEVYCQGNMELLGTINGSCYTERFIANQFGSKYINHIYNGEIKPFSVKNYAGLPFEKEHEKSIVKWLY